MKLTLIAAVGSDGSIGRGGNLAFHVSADLRHFKELTMGAPVIMGRRTFESLPKGALPGRRNIVVTHNTDFSASGIETFGTIDDAIAATAGAPETFIIGGAQVYAATIGRADCLQLTEIDSTCADADTFFPAIDPRQWQVAERGEDAVDQRSGLVYRFVTLTRLRQ